MNTDIPTKWTCDNGDGTFDHDLEERHESTGELDGGPGNRWSWRECRVCGARDEPPPPVITLEEHRRALGELLGGERKQIHYPCGCVECVCEDEERCHGCGAKSCGKDDCFLKCKTPVVSKAQYDALATQLKELAEDIGWLHTNLLNTPISERGEFAMRELDAMTSRYLSAARGEVSPGVSKAEYDALQVAFAAASHQLATSGWKEEEYKALKDTIEKALAAREKKRISKKKAIAHILSLVRDWQTDGMPSSDNGIEPDSDEVWAVAEWLQKRIRRYSTKSR